MITANQFQKMINTMYYRRSQREEAWFGKGAFKLRFPKISSPDSLVNCGFFKTMYRLIQWKWNYVNQGIPTNQQQLERLLPINLDPIFITSRDKIRYTWIGHSTAVLSFGPNINFIIDPVFAQRASPYQWLGPKRFRPPACPISRLPQIHAVLVSHDHYDHLDETSLNQLESRFHPHFIFGLDSSDVFPKGSQMHEMDWTQTQQIKIEGQIFKITFVPVAHWSRRWVADKNKRLWGGFVIETPNHKKIFYSGDTGYCQIFKQLGDLFGGFDLAILPIGAYYPRQVLSDQHVDPQQAVIIHQEIKSKKSVGVHWGTFPLGFEHYAEAPKLLDTAKQKHGLRDEQFITVMHGGSFEIDS